MLEARAVDITIASGEPPAIRGALEKLLDQDQSPSHIFTTSESYATIVRIKANIPALESVPVIPPPSHTWPTFLKTDNLLNVANQIAVMAIVAVGMTMVIITAGIDLSVGSLIALSTVVTAWLVRRYGGVDASTAVLIAASLGGMAVCACFGGFSGLMITRFDLPPFIATLAIMLVARGFAYIISEGRPIYEFPDRFTWLGRGSIGFGIPAAVALMGLIYALAWVVMSRTRLGRHIYAVGGNPESARLSGIPNRRVLMFVYTATGALAGLGGVVMASQLKGGAGTYAPMYELYIIASVVVGGTSLSGGQGRILNTLIGAFIIAVIQNGMNLTNVESYTQNVVLGFVILGAVLLDGLKRKGFGMRWFRRAQETYSKQ
ncbi:MAG: ABC transporter permease [Candidatus Hydrogenedentota bacterium]